jgi:hypothetical protein
MVVRHLLVTVALLVVGCGRDEAPGPSGPVRLTKAGEGDVAQLVMAAQAEAKRENRRLLVYVGAVWCEPCVEFHHAAERGDLDKSLPGLTVLEFDLDVDEDRLITAGYQSEMIPLFVVPGPDGRASDRGTSGARTGEDYVAQLTPRLQALFAAK